MISGDSDFSPLVSKLRENSKFVIGIGVKNSTSDLLTNNCDEFIYYDDLVQDNQTTTKRKKKSTKQKTAKKDEKSRKSVNKKAEDDPLDAPINLILETVEALYADYGDRKNIWGSMIKQAIKRRKPGFNERVYGVRSFSDLLEEAEHRGLVKLELDERSGSYQVKTIS